MSHVKNVIQTSDTFAAALQHLNRDSTIALLQQVMSISEAANQELSVDLNGKIVEAKTELQSAINVLSVKTDQALAAAKILEGAELDQLIDAFKRFIETTGMQKIIQDAAVKIGPTTYRLGSVMEVLALADKDAQLEILHNASGSELIGVRYTLTDGLVITFDAVVREEDAGILRYVFQTQNWRGLPASFECKYRRIGSELAFFGRKVQHTKFLPVLHTNLVFDLCNKFEILSELTESDVLPDLTGLGGAAGSGGAPGGSANANANANANAAAGGQAGSTTTTTTTTTTTSSSTSMNEESKEVKEEEKSSESFSSSTTTTTTTVEEGGK